jgi:glioma pathogenesis-related protein 2
LLKLFVRSPPSSNNHHDRKVERHARHRYERPSTWQASLVDKQHHRTESESTHLVHAKLISNMLYLHNYYRARHSAAPLVISQRLNRIAQSYAEHLAATSTFEHSGSRLDNEPLGENLYMQWISRGRVPVSVRSAMKSWYEEIDLYDFQHPKYSEETGHFTQLVWKSTKKLGVGVALSADGREVYFVTNYYPAGNFINHGFFERNVLPVRDH